jgi:hypothetical protein
MMLVRKSIAFSVGIYEKQSLSQVSTTPNSWLNATGSAPANVTTISALQGGQLNGSASNQSNVLINNTLLISF